MLFPRIGGSVSSLGDLDRLNASFLLISINRVTINVVQPARAAGMAPTFSCS